MHLKIYTLYVCFGGQEANMMAAGFSYTPKKDKKKEEYNSYRSIHMIDFEFGLSAMHQIPLWNIFT